MTSLTCMTGTTRPELAAPGDLPDQPDQPDHPVQSGQPAPTPPRHRPDTGPVNWLGQPGRQTGRVERAGRAIDRTMAGQCPVSRIHQPNPSGNPGNIPSGSHVFPSIFPEKSPFATAHYTVQNCAERHHSMRIRCSINSCAMLQCPLHAVQKTSQPLFSVVPALQHSLPRLFNSHRRKSTT